jgi:hypothetical protein
MDVMYGGPLAEVTLHLNILLGLQENVVSIFRNRSTASDFINHGNRKVIAIGFREQDPWSCWESSHGRAGWSHSLQQLTSHYRNSAIRETTARV